LADAHTSEMVWDPHDSSSVPSGEHAPTSAGTEVREVIQAGDALCHAAALALNLGQTRWVR